VKPLEVNNPWFKLPRMKAEQQNEFLGKLLSMGRLSRTPRGNFIVLSDRNSDSGAFFNPSFTDGTTLYFVEEKDVIFYIIEKQSRLNRNFSYYRLCCGNCHD